MHSRTEMGNRLRRRGTDYFIDLFTSCSTAKSIEFDPSELVKKKEGMFSAPDHTARIIWIRE